MQTNEAVDCGPITKTLLAPDDCTVTTPVELLTTTKRKPVVSVDVTGNTTVCVVVPVKNWNSVLATVSVVVPAAVAVVVYPGANVVATAPAERTKDVPVATPIAGVTRLGDVVSTIAPEPLTFCPSAVTTPVPVVVVAGAAPAPPPMTIAFAARAADDAHVEALLK